MDTNNYIAFLEDEVEALKGAILEMSARKKGYTEKSFYLVWNPGRDVPKRRHDTIDDARKEARRLAELQPGEEFFVLRAVEGIQYREDPWRMRTFCKR